MIERCVMTPDELRFALVELGITQVELARLIDVTPRAITLWLGNERGIPGSVEAYIRLLKSLPQGQRQIELSRLNKGAPTMKDGIYHIEYEGTHGQGYAMLVFDGGRIYGSDALKGEYDGQYIANPTTGAVDVSLKVKMPPNAPSVLGIVQPFEWALEIRASMNPAQDSGVISVANNLRQPLRAHYQFMRALPLAA
jgi:hypothetical protein